MAGGAISLLSCRSTNNDGEEDNFENLMTHQADSLVIIESTAGNKLTRSETPLMEVYDYAKEPYREFRKGVEIIKYNDSTTMEESRLVADYAINFINQELWEAKGNVVVTNINGQVLTTQQLFWNQRTGRIYSNVDSKLTQGNDVIVGVGFESDEKFDEWEVRQPVGKVHVEFDPNRKAQPHEDSDGGGEDNAEAQGEQQEDMLEGDINPSDRDERIENNRIEHDTIK